MRLFRSRKTAPLSHCENPTRNVRGPTKSMAIAIGLFESPSTSTEPPTGLEKCDDMAAEFCGSADVWKGGFASTQVAIKCYRCSSSSSFTEVKEVSTQFIFGAPYERSIQLLEKRVPEWKGLAHPNILPLLGVILTPFELSVAYDRGTNGNVNQYLVSHPRAPRVSLVPTTAIMATSNLTSFIYCSCST